MVEVGQPAAERDARPACDGTHALHTAPTLEQRHRPDRDLLQADDVGLVLRHQLHHLAEEGAPLWRGGISLGEGPPSVEHAPEPTSGGGGGWENPPPSPPPPAPRRRPPPPPPGPPGRPR